MLEIDAATGTLTIPIWAAGAGSAVFLASIVLAIGRAGAGALINALFRIGIVVIVLSAGWFYMQRTEQQEQATERRLLSERLAALLTRAVAPGSALSCLDELAGEAVEVACEKAVFASPEAVANAVTYITAKLAVLADGSEYARRAGTAFAAELVPLRAALELDRFGIVAHVLAKRYGCTADKCDILSWFSDHSHVLANLRDHTFDEHVTKFAANWNGPPRTAADATAAVAPTAAVPVSPRYDFPSSQSIPPINIMVPEAPASRVGAASGGQPASAPANDNSRSAITPVPPRRPPQGRTPPAVAGSRPPSPPQPAVPIAVGEAPTDGAVPHPSGPAEPR